MPETETPTKETVLETIAGAVKDGIAKEFTAGSSTDPAAVLTGRVNVRRPGERYCSTKSVGQHVTTGAPVTFKGRQVETPSELEFAKMGALLKWQALKSGAGFSGELSDHERSLIEETFDKDTFCGKVGGEYQTGIPGSRAKALLSDATSGGQEVNPEFFDDAIVTFPLLHSELLPMIDLREVPRGNSVEAASVGNPTLTWDVGEGTAMTPFSTTSLVAAIDTSLFDVSVAMEIGLDLLADSPADLGRILVENVGESMLAELDDVICNGTGSTQPTGIFTGAAGTTITTANDTSGPAAVGDAEQLIFGLDKQYRRANLNPCFVANDTTYRRFRAVPVGSSDQRRVFGMDHQTYQMLQYPFKVQNSVGNNDAAFVALKKYRLYRRQGAMTRFERGGNYLALRNMALLVVRGRYGGKMVDSNALAVTNTLQD